MVLGAYRRDDFANPDSFVIQLGMVLERYSDAIVTEATSPLTGLQRECKFPPSISEAVQFCNELQRRATYASKWDEHSRKQLDEREELLRNAKAETPAHRAAVVARVKAELAGHGFNFEVPVAANPEFREPHRPPGCIANVFVAQTMPQYPAMLERTKTAPRREWYYDPDRKGLWVALGWLEDAKAKVGTWRRMTSEELQRAYPRRATA